METRDNRIAAAELKFLVTEDCGRELERWARRWLHPDPHGAEYRVTSLYFDTAAQDVWRRNGSYARAKFRVRRYGDSDLVFLERKLRSREAVTKRRAIVPLRDLPEILESHGDRNLHPSGSWFQRRIQVRSLEPVFAIEYLRMAHVLDRAGLRMTLDRDLRAFSAGSFGGPGTEDQSQPLLPPGQWILELKFRRQLPDLFRDLIRDFALAPRPVSKFRLASEVMQNVAA